MFQWMCRLRKQHIRNFPHLFILQSPPSPHHRLHHCPHRDQSDSYQVDKQIAPHNTWMACCSCGGKVVRECEVGSLTCDGRCRFTEMRQHLQMFSHGDSVYFCNLENLALLFYLLHSTTAESICYCCKKITLHNRYLVNAGIFNNHNQVWKT